MPKSIRLTLFTSFVVVLAACGGGGGGDVTLTLAPGDYSRVRVATFDPATGAVALAPGDLDDGAATPTKSTDAAPVHFGGTSALLLRDLGQLAVLGDDGLTVVRRIDLNDAGDTMHYASNPQAVAAVSGSKAYVSRLAKNTLLVIDPSKSGAAAQLHTIDLSGFQLAGDTDGHVDMSAAIVVGTRLYVALGRYYTDSTTFSSVYPGTSVVAVIDTTTDTLVDTDSVASGVQGIVLEQNGPVALAALGGKLLVASNGAYGVADGGIEVVDLGTFSTRSIVSEATLTPAMGTTGDLSALAVAGGTLVALAGDRAVVVDASTGALGTMLVPSGATGLVATGGSDVAVGLGTHVAVYDVATGTDVTPPGAPTAFEMMLSLAGMAGAT